MANFMAGIFRSIMFFFDQIIYGFVPTIYNFIMDLARVRIFEEESLQKIADNVYGILGLYMVFRVAFIMLTAIVDPDKLTSKETGAAKLLGKVIIALILIVAIPMGFQFAYRLQADILKNNVIEKLIIGRPMNTQNSNSGQYMGSLALQSFLTCHTGLPELECKKLQLAFSEAFPQTNREADFNGLSNNLNKTFVDDSGEEVFAYDYKAGISTICGAVILFMLITFSFDVAVRMVKLGFLQMISPIAVIGYIEPKNDIFKKWLSLCASTYVNLFIRIISISFVTYVLSSISLDLTVLYGNDLEGSTLLFAQIFIILGLLIFAKEVPKILTGMFGIKEDSIGSLNPLNKLKSVPFIGGAAATGIGLGLSAAGGVLGSTTGKGLAGAGGALGGGVRSLFGGGGNIWSKAGLRNIGSGMKSGFSAGAGKVPISHKAKFGSVATGVLGAGYAGLTNEDAQIAAMKRKLGPSNDVSSLFKSEPVRSSYNNFATKKGNFEKSKVDATAFANNYNKFSRASQLMASSKVGRDAAVVKAESLKTVMDNYQRTGDIRFSQAKRDYDDYVNGAEYSVAKVYEQAQVDLKNAQTDFTTLSAGTSYRSIEEAYFGSQAEMQAASEAMAKAETTFKAILDSPENKKDAETYKSYKAAKDKGRI